MIWSRPATPDAFNTICEGTMVSHLGIRFVEVGDDHVVAEMPVGPKVHQPMGLLHGGASVALAETVGSMAANACLQEGEGAVGMSINASHLRAVREGTVRATARPIHRGRRSQVWSIEIEDERGRPVCTSRLTMAVVQTPGAEGEVASG